MLSAFKRVAAAVVAGSRSFGASLSASTAFTGVSGSGYEAARQGRRLGVWNAPSTHINTMLSWQGATLRNRTRDLARNNPYIRLAIDDFAAKAVGFGFKASSRIAADAPRRAMNALFAQFGTTIDADGCSDFGGLMELVCRGYLEAGEVFVRRRPRRLEDGLAVPLQVQVLPADLLPLEDNRTLQNGNAVRSGIEFDAIGRRVAYWFLRRHPGDLTDQRALATLEQVRVPASEIMHVFRRRDAGQIRGEPALVAALVRAFFFDQYEDAELERKKLAAMFTAVVTKDHPEQADGEVAIAGGTATKDPDGTERDAVEPGTTMYMMTGEKVEFPQAADVGPNFEAFMHRMLLGIAAAAGVPYASMTGDLRNANYSSIRAGMVDFRTRLEQFQWNVLVHLFCRPLWAWFVEAAALAGQIPRGEAAIAEAMKVKWITPKLPWVDPMKDMQAEILAVDNCIKSISDVIEETGEDPDDVFQRIAEDDKRMKALGIQRRAAPGTKMAGEGDATAESQPPDPARDEGEDDDRQPARSAGRRGRRRNSAA